jgi:hypothetical protein
MDLILRSGGYESNKEVQKSRGGRWDTPLFQKDEGWKIM